MKHYLIKTDEVAKSSIRQLVDYASASTLATAVACTATNFLQVIKTRTQVAASSEVGRIRPDDKESVIKVARNLIKEVGLLRASVKGLHMNLLHAMPASVLGMVIIEAIEPENASNEQVL
ncbi:mitochondrial iron ion transporter (predicted) [Sugiyamaella lignohabitans]|uniref:Mitochondrial iron ion transporter (Predicted) n=1 Tax=Sugiyamaella lignohabitans TaxID=796027 RepID=A0A167EHR5_9ASCO|nr:mitochondrial iron ion transporter (predicted) [Sugiyamaella lignohabitans]ANB14098.1 mitochondrial iron ion transporter (predicted) [Sugiyamaella lignohabitans]